MSTPRNKKSKKRTKDEILLKHQSNVTKLSEEKQRNLEREIARLRDIWFPKWRDACRDITGVSLNISPFEIGLFVSFVGPPLTNEFYKLLFHCNRISCPGDIPLWRYVLSLGKELNISIETKWKEYNQSQQCFRDAAFQKTKQSVNTLILNDRKQFLSVIKSLQSLKYITPYPWSWDLESPFKSYTGTESFNLVGSIDWQTSKSTENQISFNVIHREEILARMIYKHGNNLMTVWIPKKSIQPLKSTSAIPRLTSKLWDKTSELSVVAIRNLARVVRKLDKMLKTSDLTWTILEYCEAIHLFFDGNASWNSDWKATNDRKRKLKFLLKP